MSKMYYENKKFALVSGGPKSLKVSWTFGFKEVKIELDGAEVGVFENAHKTLEGKNFQMPDGSTLFIKRRVNPVGLARILPYLRRNELPIPGSAADPQLELNASSWIFIWTGIVSLIYILFLYSIDPAQLIPSIALLVSILAVAAIPTGIFIKKQSTKALWIGVVIAAIWTLLNFVTLFRQTGFDIIDALFEFLETALFAYGLKEGFSAIKRLNELKSSAALIMSSKNT